MNPQLTLAIAEQRIAEFHATAAADRRAAAARAGHGTARDHANRRGAGRLFRSLGRRRYRQVELIWPDGVCSVVPAQPADRERPLTNSRR